MVRDYHIVVHLIFANYFRRVWRCCAALKLPSDVRNESMHRMPTSKTSLAERGVVLADL